MKKRICRLSFLMLLLMLTSLADADIEYLAAVGANHPDGEAGAANARWVRVSGSDIVSDIGTFSHLYVSRDGGRTWETVFENDAKVIDWNAATGSDVLGTVTIPAGHYTLARDQQSSEVLTMNVTDGSNGVKQISHNIGGDESLCEESCDLTVERNGSATLRLYDPIIRIDLLIQWNGSTYTVLNCINDYSQAELSGSRFITD